MSEHSFFEHSKVGSPQILIQLESPLRAAWNDLLGSKISSSRTTSASSYAFKLRHTSNINPAPSSRYNVKQHLIQE